MKKIKDDEDLRAIARERADIKRRLYERYFNLFASSWEWGGFAREEREAIIRSLWTRGTIGALRISDELLAYVPYAPQDFNLYGTPVTAVPVPSRTAPYIPTRALSTSALRINQARGVEEPEIVLGWAQHTLRPIRDSLADWVDDLVELEMAIRMNIDLQKIPFILKSTNQNEAKLRNLIQRVMFGSRMVAIGVDEVGSVDAMTTGAPYLLDKLEEQKERIEKEVLTFLGIDNLKEKPERMQGDEINANNDEININRDAILDNVKEWVRLVDEAFGTSHSVEAKTTSRSLYEEEPNQEEKNDDEPGNDID